MARKGYGFEYKVKNILKKDGWIPFKCAINSYSDYVCLKVVKVGKNHVYLVKLVECKTHKHKWYLSKREKEQLQVLLDFHNVYGVPVEYWVREKGKFEILSVKQAYKRFMKR